MSRLFDLYRVSTGNTTPHYPGAGSHCNAGVVVWNGSALKRGDGSTASGEVTDKGNVQCSFRTIFDPSFNFIRVHSSVVFPKKEMDVHRHTPDGHSLQTYKHIRVVVVSTSMCQPKIPALLRQPILLQVPPQLVVPMRAKRIHRRYRGRPALLNRHYIGTTITTTTCTRHRHPHSKKISRRRRCTLALSTINHQSHRTKALQSRQVSAAGDSFPYRTKPAPRISQSRQASI